MRWKGPAAGALAALALGAAAAVAAGGGSGSRSIELTPLGVYRTGSFAATAAEIGAYDAKTRRVFVTNSADHVLDVLDVSDPASPAKVRSIDLTPYGSDPTSVAVNGGRVAVAVVAAVKTDPGSTRLFDVLAQP
jgi:hypothetical protein